MGNFLNVQICGNGHITSLDIEMYSFRFCPQCGSQTFYSCPSCGEPIRGKYFEYDTLFVPEPPDQTPFYCHNCGKPYPWTQKIIDNAIELLSLDENLDPDAKYRSAMSKTGQIVKDSMRQLLIDIITESAKKIIYP